MTQQDPRAAAARELRARYASLRPLPQVLGGLMTVRQADGTWRGWIARVIPGREFVHEARGTFADSTIVEVAKRHARARRGLIRGVRIVP